MLQAYLSWVAEEMTMSGDKNFDRETLEYALAELGRRAFAAGRTVEIVIYGGSALLLTLNRQINTGDVDAVFEGNKDFVRSLAAEMAEEFKWDENWLNDGVKTRLGLEEIFSNLDVDNGDRTPAPRGPP
jgi:hypothetical protein